LRRKGTMALCGLPPGDFPLSIFDVGRSPPRPPKRMLRPMATKNEKESLSIGLMQDRDKVAKVAKEALLSGKCPAAALFAYRDGARSGTDLIESAITVCSAVSGTIAYDVLTAVSRRVPRTYHGE